MRRTHWKRSHRRGYTLVVFVLFILCLLALAAIVIDLGIVRLSKLQMQSMTDAAALEVQREIDGGNLSQPFEMSEAGPTLNFEADGTTISGDFRAHPELGGTGKWIPSLEMSQGHLTDDILVGDYQGDSEVHRELEVNPLKSGYYERPDFNLDATGSDVLVRLRRTGESLPEGGSAGPPIPFFFGRGVVIGGSYNVWQRIERGTYVRQTSISQQNAAKSVGPYVEFANESGDTVGMVGLINVQLSFADWQSADEVLDSTKFTIYDPGDVSFTSIGDPAKSSTGDVILTTRPKGYPDNSGYVMIVDNLDRFNGESVVIGFGYVFANHDDQSLTKASRRGFQNTSATPRPSRNLTGEQWEEVIDRNREFYSVYDGVSAPAIVRSEE